MLARGWLAYPVTPMHHPSTAEERLYKRHHMVGLHSLVAERRHSSVTRYAKRSVACRDSPRQQPLRAGGTPLPRHRRLPHHIVRHHHRIAPSSQYIAIGEKPPKSGCINAIPRFALSRRRATALFHNPVCKAQRSVPGFSSTPTSACRRYATSPPPIVLRIHIVRHPSICASEMRSCADRASGHAFS